MNAKEKIVNLQNHITPMVTEIPQIVVASGSITFVLVPLNSTGNLSTGFQKQTKHMRSPFLNTVYAA
jgi:hypothetical protein